MNHFCLFSELIYQNLECFIVIIVKIFGQFVNEDITMPGLYPIWSMMVVIWVLRFIIILPRRQITD